jgi:integrase
MGRKHTGLRNRNGTWHIEKRILGVQVHESCKTTVLKEAQLYLARKVEEVRKAKQYGIRPRRTFREAATKYLEEHQHKRSIADDAMHLAQLDPYIGHVDLANVHDGTLAVFVRARRGAGIRSKSINLALGVVRRTLNLAARSWRDELTGKTWLESAPLVTMLKVDDAAKPYPLDHEEERALLQALPPHLARMALFDLHTGLREQELCGLEWAWEVPVPELNRSVFIIPASAAKNGEERVVVFNAVAWSVVEGQRGQDAKYVFPFRHRRRSSARQVGLQENRLRRMHSSAWKRAWRDAGLPTGSEWKRGVHNLRHTFGRRLRAAGVSLETRRVLLGHKNGDLTTHYSAPELRELLNAVERLCRREDFGKTPALTVLKFRSAG